jgi:hypothetical protein
LMAVLERMRAGKLRVFNDLDDWWREFRTYRRDAKGKIVKRNDHLLDATRYAIVSGLHVARAEGETKQIKRKRPESGDWRVL